MPNHTKESIQALIGKEVGVSDWLVVTQDMINQFADLTDDHQFIHTDPELAKKTPLGGTVAHGFLTLSLIGGFCKSADTLMQGVVMGFNYGFDKVRFLAPVKEGGRIRGRFTLKSMREKSPGQWLSVMDVVIDIEGEEKPALAAEWLGLQIVQQA